MQMIKVPKRSTAKIKKFAESTNRVDETRVAEFYQFMQQHH